MRTDIKNNELPMFIATTNRMPLFHFQHKLINFLNERFYLCMYKYHLKLVVINVCSIVVVISDGKTTSAKVSYAYQRASCVHHC